MPEEDLEHVRTGEQAPAADKPATAGLGRGLLDEVAEGYRAMDERRAIKVLLQP